LVNKHTHTTPKIRNEFASALAEASAWEYAEELTRADELSRN
jgi:hypothetical protein